MHTTEQGIIYAATDLSDFLACPHLTQRSLAAARGGPRPPQYDDPAADVLRTRGEEHERIYLKRLEAESLTVATVERDADFWKTSWADKAQETLDAMRAGVAVVYQGVLFDGKWLGRPDFLRRVETPSDLGAWSYEVVDAKLAREAKAGAVLQISLYSDLLGDAQGGVPRCMHLALGGPDARIESFRVSQYAAYYRSVRRRFLEAVEREPLPDPYPEPVAHCDICAWKTVCNDRRHADDHLSLVAGIARRQRQRLEEREVTTMAALAQLPLPVEPPLDGSSRAATERVREQARIQVEGREANQPRYELLEPVEQDFGLAALPEPSPGDLFFDIEGDPHALDDGLEYLFGYADRDGEYVGLWALSRAREKAMFERFIDTVTERLERHPKLHIYHYAAYEKTALQKLMGRHATREEQVDRLLRGRVLVDLHRVVRQGLRASVESYSIKKMEPFYGYAREVDLRDASSALAHFEAWLALGDTERFDSDLLSQVEGYNRDDCLSTLRLREWLESLRDELAEQTGQAVPRPSPADAEPSEAVAEQHTRTDQLVRQLTADVPADEQDWTATQRARWLLAQLLGWHRREKKSTWWEYFRCLALTAEEMIEDRSTLAGLVYEGVVETIKKSHVHRYRFPPQEHGIGEGTTVRDPATERSPGTVYAVDSVARTIDLKRGKTSKVAHPSALVPLDDVPDQQLRDSLHRIAEWVLSNDVEGEGPFRAARDLLLRVAPRAGHDGGPLRAAGERAPDAAKRLVMALDRSVLPVQGPPGSGKTYTGARMIMELLKTGKRVGVTATSHKVIGNLLKEVVKAGGEAGTSIAGIQKVSDEQQSEVPGIATTTDNAAVAAALGDGSARLAAGTAWLWAREEMMGAVDVLFIDEAGQMSLANVLAVSPATDSLVLLGDPQQLEQPQHGVHPPGAGVSALDHVIGGQPTITDDRGLFLDRTWRLHPEICAFTSEMFYDGRLESRDGLEAQRVDGAAPPRGSGMRFSAVPHAGNRNESPEEVRRVADLVGSLLEGGSRWTDVNGTVKPLALEDILVVAPYNVQVAALAEALPPEARVGTVDKFQGQQAPVVIYSMATSSAEEAPRGMEFLFSPNRLNVATSRAMCLAIVVASPDLFAPECRSPRQMRLANAFCRFLEVAG